MESDFLQLMETVRAEQADASERIAKLFEGEGRGSARNRTRNDGGYLTRLNEAVKVYAGAFETRRGLALFQEALTTSDFANLFGDIIDRQMLGYYQEAPYTWSNWARRGTVPDFRTVKRFAIDGSEAVLAAVAEQTEYPESKLVDAKYSYAVSKYGRRLPFSWETIINDDLDALKDAPARFGRAARRSEEKFVTGLAFDASGPHATMYASGNKNIINATNSGGPYTAVNPPLSIAALAQGLVVLANMKDTEGEPISIEAVELVVCPALGPVAKNILNATQLLVGSFGQSATAAEGSGGSAMYQMMTANWLANNLRLSIDYYIPIVCSSANANTSWILVASPSIGRPAYEVGFLRGHEAPEIFIKEPNARRVGAGSSDPMNGDFDNDSINYKLRHVFGGVRLDPKATVGSNGSGS
jgi:hypothetical protein